MGTGRGGGGLGGVISLRGVKLAVRTRERERERERERDKTYQTPK